MWKTIYTCKKVDTEFSDARLYIDEDGKQAVQVNTVEWEDITDELTPAIRKSLQCAGSSAYCVLLDGVCTAAIFSLDKGIEAGGANYRVSKESNCSFRVERKCS